MQISFHKKFHKDLKRISSEIVLRKFFKFVEKVEAASHLHELSDIKKLKDSKDCYRHAIGDYRVGFRCDGNVVKLERFLHRKDLYKYFPR